MDKHIDALALIPTDDLKDAHRVALAQAYYHEEKGEYEQAVDKYRASLSIHHNDPATMERLASLFEKMGRLKESLGCFTLLAERYPDNIAAI